MVHESDVRCIVTVRKECWWYMNQMYCYCKKGVLIVHESDGRCIVTVIKGVLVVHESDVRCIVTVRKE